MFALSVVGAIHESPEILKSHQNKLMYILCNSFAINLYKHISRRRAMRHKGGESPLRLQKCYKIQTTILNALTEKLQLAKSTAKRLDFG